MIAFCRFFAFFFFNDTATTEIYTLSLHDALPISRRRESASGHTRADTEPAPDSRRRRSEEHTSELQSRLHLVCRLLLEKKKKTDTRNEEAEHSPPEAADPFRCTRIAHYHHER